MSDRNYSKSFNQQKAAPVFSYVEDSTLNSGEGGWRPLKNTDFAGGGGGGGGDASAANQLIANNLLTSLNAKTQDITVIGGQTGVNTFGYLQKYDGTFVVPTATEKNSLSVGNANVKFRDGFVEAQPDSSVWNLSVLNSGTSFISKGGNSSASSYLNISLCPFTADSEIILSSKQSFDFPVRYAVGISASQRILGQEFSALIAGCDASDNIEYTSSVSDLTISGTITIASNVATINFATNHGLRGGDRIALYGNTERRLNVGPVAVTIVTPLQITVPLTLTNGTYTAGGFIKVLHPVNYLKNSAGFVFGDTTTATNAFCYTRRNGSAFRASSQTVNTTVATQSNTSPYTDALNSAGEYELIGTMEDFTYLSRATDSSAASTSFKFTQGLPDEENGYKIFLKAKNFINLSRPIARITAISKSGTTTATVTTDVNHGLAIGDYIQIYGVRDQTNFPNLTASTAVVSIVSSTQFTIIIGSAVTASSAGGSVAINNGSVLWPGISAIVAQSISRSNNVLSLVGNATWTGFIPGEYVHLYGCDATSMGLYDGAYKVLRINTTTLELESVGADFGSINCGGAVMKRTDVRIHYVRCMEYTRLVAELGNGRGAPDLSRQISANVNGTVSATQSGTWTVMPGNTANTTAWLMSMNPPTVVADVTSAAITSTATTTAITPSFGNSYQVNIPVTAVSGTTPTMDVSIEESDDGGTNWFKIYDFPRITASGMYRSPFFPVRGNRVRYVQTIAGTSPSFTRSVNRIQSFSSERRLIQLIDRTIIPNTVSTASAAIYSEGCSSFNLSVRCSAQTTAATINLQGSDDGTNWITISDASLNTVSGTAKIALNNVQFRFVRAFVSTAGTGITLGELVIKGLS